MSTTTAFFTGLAIGAITVDFLWAWKMGIVTSIKSRFMRRFNAIFRK